MSFDPGLSMLLGTITAEASRIETELARYFAQLVFAERLYSDGGEAIAMEVIESLQSVNAKCATIMIAARQRLDKKTADGLQRKLKGVQEAIQRRSKVVHARWASGTEEVTYARKLLKFNRMGNPKQPVEWTTNDFNEILIALNHSDYELRIFFQAEVSPKLKAISDAFLRDLSALQEAQSPLLERRALQGPETVRSSVEN